MRTWVSCWPAASSRSRIRSCVRGRGGTTPCWAKAIAVALRTSTPIFGAEEVLEEAGISIPDEQEDEVEKFREFLDQISPEDFQGPPHGQAGG